MTYIIAPCLYTVRRQADKHTTNDGFGNKKLDYWRTC